MNSNRTGERASSFAPVERWVSLPAGGREAEDRFASLIRTAGPPGELGAVARARVWARLRRRPAARARIGHLRWGVALGLLLTSGVVLGALSARRWWPARPARTEPGSTPARPRASHGVRGLAQPPLQPAPSTMDSPPVDQPVPQPVPAAAPPAPPVRASAAPHASPARARIVAQAEAPAPTAEREPETVSPPAATPGPAASALSGETPLLSEALLQLRQKRDARGALAALDEYRARYPNGTLKREAESARIDALLLLGRNDEALAELRALSLQAAGRDQELRLIRGELAAATDCKRAFVDFDRLLNEKVAAALVERALHGRAACRLRLGDETGAIRDLTEYLRRFPEGRFAPEARRTVEAPRQDL
jgi:hypothetical protein